MTHSSVPTTNSLLSVVIITKNEEHNIRDCLKSVDWADEIVVVDAESTDGTVAEARRFTDKVFVRSWAGFGPQKILALTRPGGTGF